MVKHGVGATRIANAEAPERCRLCGAPNFDRHLHVADARFSSRIESFDIFRCRQCELCVMHPFPVPADFEELYVQNSLFSKQAPNPSRHNFLFPLLEPIYRRYGDGRHFIVRNCRRLARRRPIRHLDIGCSTGALMDAFRTMVGGGADVAGIDVDLQARENAPNSLRENILVGDPLQLDLPGDYDVITMEMVIEHLSDPLAYVRRCHELLRPGGILMLSTPNIYSKPARDQGQQWWLIRGHREPVGHVHWFTPGSMRELAGRAGFRIVALRRRGSLVPYLPRWLYRAIEAFAGTDPHSGRLIRWYPVRILWALVIDGWLSEVLNKGEYIYVFLVKDISE